MTELEDFLEILDITKKEGFHLIYLSRPACGVCKAIREARYLSMDDLDSKIERPYRLAFN